MKFSYSLSVFFILCILSTNALEDFDDEEFERPKEEAKIVDDELVVEDDIGEIKQPPVQEPKKAVNTKSSTGLPPQINIQPKEDRTIEYLLIFGFSLYLMCYMYGRMQNSRIAQKWYDLNCEFLKTQFAKVGYESGNIDKIVKDAEDDYKIYCYGRRNCSGMICHLKLKSRQDLFSVLWYMISPKEDTVQIDVSLPMNKMGHCVFAICRKRDQRSYHFKMRDLNNYATVIGEVGIPNGFPKKNYSILTESPELVSKFIPKEFVEILNKSNNSKLLKTLHVTDERCYNENDSVVLSTNCIGMEYSLSELFNENMKDNYISLMQYVMWLIDEIPNLKLSKESEARSKMYRELYLERKSREEHEEREEKAQQRKEEERKKYLSEYSELSEEAKRKRDKAEEKRKKKEKEKSLKQRIKVVR